MGLRFRKSIRLGNNVRLNLSKSGASVTAGVKGLSVNTGPRGTYLNAGIPGSGLSTRTRLGGPSQRSSGSGNRQSGTQQSGNQQGGIRQSSGRQAGRSTAVSPEQQQAWDDLRNQTEQATYDVVNIHELAPDVFTYQEVESSLSGLVFQPFERQAYPRLEPTQAEIEAALRQQAKERVRPLLFRQKKQQEYFETNYRSFWQYYVDQWLAEKEAFETSQAEAERSYNDTYGNAYNAQKRWLERSLQNNSEVIEADVEEWLSALELPVEMAAQIEYSADTSTLFIDLDLPEIEDMPKSTTRTLKSGEVKTADKSQKQLREEYASTVFGLVVLVAACAFSINACIKLCVVSGYTRRRERSGELTDDYILSVKVPRNALEHVRVTDPERFVMSCENRVNITQTYVFKSIIPYDVSN